MAITYTNLKSALSSAASTPSAFFIVDFICLEAKLIIELDGEIHLSPEHTEYDLGRTFTLTELGYRELRFTNQQVLTSLDEVLATITENIPTTLLSNAPSGSPLCGRGGRRVR